MMNEEEKQNKLIDLAFEHYRKVGFPYPDLAPHELWEKFFTLQELDLKINKKTQGFFNQSVDSLEVRHEGISTANYFHPHIWDSHALGMRSPTYSFSLDVSLRKAIFLALTTQRGITDTKLLSRLRIVNGTQMCSNFRPLAAKAVYKKYLKGTRILDPSTGYGGRLLGFLALGGDAEYIGVDPSTKTCAGNLKMAKLFGREKDVEIINEPFEYISLGFCLPFDLAFTSPPYFRKEVYSDEPTQSHNRYRKYSAWLNLFWAVVLEKVYKALRDGGIFAVNIQDITMKGDKETYPLVNDTCKIARNIGFEELDRLHMVFPAYGKGNPTMKSEPILIFQK